MQLFSKHCSGGRRCGFECYVTAHWLFPSAPLLRLSEEVSFVLLMKLRFVDSEAGFYLCDLNLLKDFSGVGSPWPAQAACSCLGQGLVTGQVVWCGIGYLNRICIAIIFPVGSGTSITTWSKQSLTGFCNSSFPSKSFVLAAHDYDCSMFQLGGWVSPCTLNQILECMEHLQAVGNRAGKCLLRPQCSCGSFHQGKGAEFPLLCLAGKAKGKRRVKRPCSAADQMFETSPAK